jgi:glycosidase
VIYQGDEIGMKDGEVAPERRRDRTGRDGCRTPMRWTSAPNGGFCPDGTPAWLPVGADPPGADVESQEADPDSILGLYRRVLALRRRSSALAEGSTEMLEVGNGHLVFGRRHREERLVVMVNMVDESVTPSTTLPNGAIVLATDRSLEGSRPAGPITLGANAAVVLHSGCGD